MNNLLFCATLVGLLLSGKADHATEKPLDLSFHGISVRPNIIPFQEDAKKGEELSIAPDAKKRIILLPAAQFTAPNGQSATIGIRPRRGGLEVRMTVPLN